MKIVLKIDSSVLAQAKQDLAREHPFAHERVGFLTVGATQRGTAALMLLCRGYHDVADEDYLLNPHAGATIGPDAMRKGLQVAYKTRSGLFHIHSHGGKGVPKFSRTDLTDAPNFVPTFFNAVPFMPHGIIVLSDRFAAGLAWLSKDTKPLPVTEFGFVGPTLVKFGSGHEPV